MDYKNADILLNDVQLSPCLIEKLKQVENPNTEYTDDPSLNATNLCDSENGEIKSLAAKLAEGCSDYGEITKAIFDFVRDQVKFEYDEYLVKASETLAKGHGICWNKALLMAALLRANNIPTKVACSELNREFLKPIKGDGYLEFDEIVPHYFNLVWLDGEWVAVDATIDIDSYKNIYVPCGINWGIDWDGKNNMQLYTEHIINPLVVVEDIDGTYA